VAEDKVVSSKAGGGSGWVGEVPIERGDRGGQFYTSYGVAVAVLTEI
jgi:hypothetical protein